AIELRGTLRTHPASLAPIQAGSAIPGYARLGRPLRSMAFPKSAEHSLGIARWASWSSLFIRGCCRPSLRSMGSAAQGQERGAGGLGVGGVASALVQLRHLRQRLGIRSTPDRAAPRIGGGGGITEGELRPPETDQRLR